LEGLLSFVKHDNSPKQRCVPLEELALVDDPLVCSFVFTDASEPFLVVTKLLVEVESLQRDMTHWKQLRKNGVVGATVTPV